MLTAVVAGLRCPVCAGRLTETGDALRCGRGHSFDLARQGYVNLLAGRAAAGGDTAAMVSARAAVLAAGHLDLVTDALVAHAPPTGEPPSDGLVPDALAGDGLFVDGLFVDGLFVDGLFVDGLFVDVGAGTGHHLAALLDRHPGRFGLALDSAPAAARSAARIHPRVAAAVCDAWRALPLADGCAALVLDVFAPRNGPEFRRILRPDGTLLVVTPAPDHLGELVTALGLLSVDPEKERRLDASLGGWFRLWERRGYSAQLALSRDHVAAFVAMGPSAWHTDPAALARRLDGLAEPIGVTASIQVHVYRPG